MTKRTTTTTKIVEALVRADDFMTTAELTLVTHETSNRVTAALHHLRKYKAIQAMDVDGTLFWYATADEDTRSRVIEEKAEEVKPRRPRKPRKKA